MIPDSGETRGGTIAPVRGLTLRCGAEVRANPIRRKLMATSTMESRETVSLIGSDKVDGTAVYGVDEKKIGKVERVMIDKKSGKVAYAVLSFGGYLGLSEDHYP